MPSERTGARRLGREVVSRSCDRAARRAYGFRRSVGCAATGFFCAPRSDLVEGEPTFDAGVIDILLTVKVLADQLIGGSEQSVLPGWVCPEELHCRLGEHMPAVMTV
jgi:hypothetical protein